MKILILGIVASGKTTLARKLAKEYSISHYEGDCIAWGFPGEARYKRSAGEQLEIMQNIDSRGDWIIDGTNRDSQKILLDMADRILWLDPPLGIRRFRIVRRYVRQVLRLEPCHYRPTLAMLRSMFHWTMDFERGRDQFEAMLRTYGPKVIRLRSGKELQGKL